MVVAASANWHEAHERALAALGQRPRLVAHCALEAYSVLTRLPGPSRVPGALVVEFLRAHFPELPLTLPAEVLAGLVSDLHQRQIAGGAVYDGLVALTAAGHGALLLTLDRRALEIYRRCGVAFRLVA